MDFSRKGYVQSLPGAFRARAQWTDSGRPRDCNGPRRPDKETAQRDLESMRTTAIGMSREDGFAAMAAEAKRLREGKPMTEGGCVKEIDRSYRAVFSWQDERDIKGPRRGYRRRRVANRHVLAEGYMDRTLVSIPFPNTALAMYLLIGFP